MNARKVLLLLAILGFGSAVEAVWNVRSHVDIGATGCRILRGGFDGPSFSFDDATTLDVPSPLRVEVANAFGAVSISEGTEGRAQISLRKVVFLRTQEKARVFAEKIKLESVLEGSTLRVGTNRASLEKEDGSVGFETHLVVRVPPGTTVKVDNDHGAVDVADVAAAEVAGSYESVSVTRVLGDARVSGRHGDVSVSRVGGSLTLTSRFGEARAEGVKGPARIQVEHGDATTRDTGHLSLEIKQGDATVGTVDGDLEVRGDHAGAKVEQVTGRATVATSFRDVELGGVGSDARLTVDHGGFVARNVKGALKGEISFGDAVLESVAGAVDLKADHSGVRGRDLTGGIRIRASGDDVSLEAFRGPVDVEVRRGSVELSPAGPVTETVTVSTVNGGVRLEVPSGSRFQLLATSDRGDVQADLPGLSVQERGPSRISGTVGEGQARVTLSADHGDVVLTPREETAQK
jgi:DUF4097 and DUF4098 domain-containing protein YvlB